MKLEQGTEKAELDKEKALFEVKNEYRDKIIEINEVHNAKIQGLYDSIENLKKEYESKIEHL